MLRGLVLLTVVAAATAQRGCFGPFCPRRPQQQFRPQQQQFRPQQQQFRPQPQQQQQVAPQQFGGGGQVDDRSGGSEYHFSWLHDGHRKYSGGQAEGYCRGLGGSWTGVSIETPQENSYVNSIIQRHRLEYVWTGGQRRGAGWGWSNGGQFGFSDWSHTGGARRAQPDNREGNESCLAILNNFYNDGVKWHDVECSHTKPIICEKRG